MNTHEAILFGEDQLRQNGVEDPRWNAERVVLIATKQDRAGLYSNLQQQLTQVEEEDYRRLLLRRSEHYPLAYLEGYQEFYGREFAVDDTVLIPRPETEEVIRAVLATEIPPNPRIVDLGAGSGIIPATLALEIPGAKVFALEYSREALSILRKNTEASGVHLVAGDLFAAPFFSGRFDIVTSNPPYVESAEYPHLPAETRWEPVLALVTQSLEGSYRGLIKTAQRLLTQGGHLVFEIGFQQEDRIQSICGEFHAMKLIEARKDAQGFVRVFTMRKGE